MEYSNGGRDTWKSYLCLRLLIWALSSWCQADRASVISAGLQALESSVLSGEEDRGRWKYNMGQERLIFMSSIPVVPFHILSDRNRTTFNPVHHHQTHVWKQSSLFRHILSYIKSDSKERRLRGNSPLTFFYGYGLIDRQILWIRWRERGSVGGQERKVAHGEPISPIWQSTWKHLFGDNIFVIIVALPYRILCCCFWQHSFSSYIHRGWNVEHVQRDHGK